jgi:hypothetical protein
MKKTRTHHKTAYLVILLVLLTTMACVGPSLQQPDDDVDTQDIVATVLAQVEPELAQQTEVAPTIPAPTPVAAADWEIEDLQHTLTRLYEEVNPSVVYIIVSSSSSASGFVYGEDGRHVYPYMAASFDAEISLDEQAVYGVPHTQGAYVVSVTPGGPADRAGLVAADSRTGQGGDLIVEIDGQPIDDFSDLNTYLVFHTQVGQTIEITILRDGQTVVLPLTLGARP